MSRRMTRYNIVERAIDFWSSWKFSSMESIKNVIQQSIWQISYKYKIIKWYNITQAIKIIKKGKDSHEICFCFRFYEINMSPTRWFPYPQRLKCKFSCSHMWIWKYENISTCFILYILVRAWLWSNSRNIF